MDQLPYPMGHRSIFAREDQPKMSYPSERARKIAAPSLLSHGWRLNVGLGWPSEPAANPWRTSAYIVDRPRQFPSLLWDHAAPLSAIPVRDLRELEDYFDRGDMPEVEADVNHLLAHLLPEPAWDEDVWAFLQECEALRGNERPVPAPRPIGIGHRFDAFL
jgi:hypothetical protein